MARPLQAERRRLVVLLVEVRVPRRRHDQARALRRRRSREPFVLPMLDQRSGRERRFRDLLPSDRRLAVRANELARARDERRVRVRRRRGRLVAADMEVLTGGQRRDFADDVVDEAKRALARRIERAETDLHPRVRNRRHGRGRELRVRDERRVHVPGEVDLRHDHDAVRVGVGDEVAKLPLRVEAAAPAANRGRSADRGEPRPRLDLDPPALVVGEVQVQTVEAVRRDQVDDVPHVLRRKEVPRDVEHQTAPFVARPVPAGDHALTAPAVRPKTIFRCTSRKKITTGIAVSVDPAISAPQSV